MVPAPAADCDWVRNLVSMCWVRTGSGLEGGGGQIKALGAEMEGRWPREENGLGMAMPALVRDKCSSREDGGDVKP